MNDGRTVLLITGDTLRYDVFYEDYDGTPWCPFLRKQATRGVDFTGAYATGSGTSSAFPGLLASAYPLDHGYRGLNDHHDPVAEQLSAQDIRTVGITASSHASSLFNYDRGFDVFYENPSYRSNAPNRSSLSTGQRIKTAVFDIARSIPPVRSVGSKVLDTVSSVRGDDESCPYERAGTMTDHAIDILDEEFTTYPDRDRFVWIHYMEPHAPYYPPDRLVKEFDTGEFTKSMVNEAWNTWKENRPPLWENETNSEILSPRQREALELFYRIQIRYLDREIERLFRFIDKSGVNAEFIFTSDHGEEFFEHGDLGHRAKVYDELVHVPLFVSSEGFESRTATEPVSHTDLGPTIAERLDVAPADTWRGTSLQPVLNGESGSLHDHVLSEVCHTSGYGGDVKPSDAVVSIVTDDWKYIRNRQTNTEELYRRGDPETAANDRSGDQQVLRELREVADERLSEIRDQEVDRREMSDELREQLHQLGYVDE